MGRYSEWDNNTYWAETGNVTFPQGRAGWHVTGYPAFPCKLARHEPTLPAGGVPGRAGLCVCGHDTTRVSAFPFASMQCGEGWASMQGRGGHRGCCCACALCGSRAGLEACITNPNLRNANGVPRWQACGGARPPLSLRRRPDDRQRPTVRDIKPTPTFGPAHSAAAVL